MEKTTPTDAWLREAVRPVAPPDVDTSLWTAPAEWVEPKTAAVIRRRLANKTARKSRRANRR